MPRNRSERLPPGAEVFNPAQREHMRNEARWNAGLDPKSVHEASWAKLSRQDRRVLCGENYTAAIHLRRHYETELQQELNAAQPK